MLLSMSFINTKQFSIKVKYFTDNFCVVEINLYKRVKENTFFFN